MIFDDFITQASEKIVIDSLFSPEDKKAILDAMRFAYEVSSIAREMFDAWVFPPMGPGRIITVNFLSGTKLYEKI